MPSHPVALITDSTNDIPDELLQQYQIDYVSSYILWGNEVKLDRAEMEAGEFYRRLGTDPVMPTTSKPTPDDFLKAYEKARQNGAQEILVITVGSTFSGTCESAREAAARFDLPVQVIDSKEPTMGLGWQVLAAARIRELGGTLKDMIAAADWARKHLALYVSLDTLDFLYKGGRIGGAAHLVSSLLNIKAQVSVDPLTGEVVAREKTRTREKAIDALFKNFFKVMDLTKPLRVAVLHNDAVREAEQLAERIRQEIAPVELFVTTSSPVLGVHTGPKALAIAGYTEP